jgi:hypothetical protein
VSQPPHRDGLVRPSWMGGGGVATAHP